jgi:hypothetical protein
MQCNLRLFQKESIAPVWDSCYTIDWCVRLKAERKGVREGWLLQVLGRSEFKQLLRWRMKVRKDLEAAEKARAKELAAVSSSLSACIVLCVRGVVLLPFLPAAAAVMFEWQPRQQRELVLPAVAYCHPHTSILPAGLRGARFRSFSEVFS